MSAPVYLLSSEQPLSRVYDTLLLDLDGTTYLGKIAAPYAPEGLAEAKKYGTQTMYLTNNSGRSPEVVAKHLSSIGIPTEASSVLNASQVAVYKVAELLPAGAKVLLVGGEGLYRAFEDSDYEIVRSADDAPDAVIQGLNEQATWADISEAVLAIHNHGALHIATNMDATLPKERGPMVGNGSFVACVQNATGSQPINCGKPEPAMFEIGARTANAQHPLGVGDRLDTDIAGAVAAGIPSLHVLTGISSARDIMLAAPECRPSYLGIDMRDVNMPHPEVRREVSVRNDADGDDNPQSVCGSVWVCGDARAWLTRSNAGAELTGSQKVSQAVGSCGADVNACQEESWTGVESFVLHIADELYDGDSQYSRDGGIQKSTDGLPSAGSAAHRELPLNSLDIRHAAVQSVPSADISHNAYRAVVCALWGAADEGIITRDEINLPEFTVHR